VYCGEYSQEGAAYTLSLPVHAAVASGAAIFTMPKNRDCATRILGQMHPAHKKENLQWMFFFPTLDDIFLQKLPG
jgi:hypothetical protein